MKKKEGKEGEVYKGTDPVVTKTVTPTFEIHQSTI